MRTKMKKICKCIKNKTEISSIQCLLSVRNFNCYCLAMLNNHGRGVHHFSVNHHDNINDNFSRYLVIGQSGRSRIMPLLILVTILPHCAPSGQEWISRALHVTDSPLPFILLYSSCRYLSVLHRSFWMTNKCAVRHGTPF